MGWALGSSGGTRPPEAETAFVKHYRELLTKPDPAPPIWENLNPTLPATVPRTWAKYSWIEIYLSVFPYSNRVREIFEEEGGHLPQCLPDCKLCTAYCEQGRAHDEDPMITPAPQWTPQLRLNRAPGIDAITAEMLRFFRSEDPAETGRYRERLAAALALFFDAMVDSGPAANIVDVVLSALAKVSKDGISPDPSIPDKTRGITLHNVLSKLHDILIDVRFMHTVVNEGIISPHQAGFMPRRSHEHCVFSLVETVRARWRQGLDTWAIFVDFSKAYDTVSPSAMWKIITKMGFPPRIIAYLKECYESRKTLFSYNGAVVDKWTQFIGLCQGGVLSCLLFNLFIESLSRHLEAKGFKGAKVTTAGGTHYTLLELFADDLCTLAGSRGSLAAIARAINEWCKAHGMLINIKGTEKTACMHFALDASTALPEPLRVKRGPGEDPLLIPFTTSYTYIGHEVHSDLDPSKMQAAIVKKLWDALGAFRNNTVLPKCSLALQRSYMLSMVMGSTMNLMAMAPSDEKFEGAVDGIYLHAIAHVLRTRRQWVTLTGHPDLRVRPAIAILLRAYERFRLHAIAYDVPAAALLKVIHADADRPTGASAQRLSRLRSWPASYYAAMRRVGFDPTWEMDLGADQPEPWHIPAHADALARVAAYTHWSTRILKYVRKFEAKAAKDPAVAARSLPPTMAVIRASSMDTVLGDDQLPTLGLYRAPVYGAGVGASIASYVRLGPETFTLLFKARTGRLALFSPPFMADPRVKPAAVARPPTGQSVQAKAARAAAKAAKARAALDAKEAEERRHRAIHDTTDCNLCGERDGDLIHLCTSCPATAARREAAYGDGRWADAVCRIAVALCLAHGCTPSKILLQSIKGTPLDGPEAVFITTRIITSSPWTEQAAPEGAAASRLGKLFDGVIAPSKVPPLADAWATEAHAFLSKIAIDWWRLLPAPARAALEAAHMKIPQA